MTFTVRRLRGCTDEPIYEVTFADRDGIDDERVLSALDGLGELERPLPDRPLIRMDEAAFVLTGNLERGRLRLRCKSSTDVEPETLHDRLEAQLSQAFEPDASE